MIRLARGPVGIALPSIAALLAVVALPGAAWLFAQDPAPAPAPPAPAPAPGEPAAPAADAAKFLLTEEEQDKVRALFHASGTQIDAEGRIHLNYRFSDEVPETADDWIPKITRENPTVRFTKGWEGTQNGTDGILIADAGQWFIDAEFAPDVAMDVTFESNCGGTKGDMIAATFAWSKMKSRVGSNLGGQIVKLSGTKSAGGMGTVPDIMFEERTVFGFVLAGGKFAATRGGSTALETEGAKFLKGLGPGRVGLVWRGNISSVLPQVTVEGRLDLDWIAEKLPDVKKRLEEHRKKFPPAPTK